MKTTERYKWRGIGRKVLLIIILLVLGGIFIFSSRGLLPWYQLHRLEESMEARNDSLAAAVQETSDRIDALAREDSLEIERAARDLGMVRPGEEVYIVREEGDTLRAEP